MYLLYGKNCSAYVKEDMNAPLTICHIIKSCLSCCVTILILLFKQCCSFSCLNFISMESISLCQSRWIIFWLLWLTTHASLHQLHKSLWCRIFCMSLVNPKEWTWFITSFLRIPATSLCHAEKGENEVIVNVLDNTINRRKEYLLMNRADSAQQLTATGTNCRWKMSLNKNKSEPLLPYFLRSSPDYACV